MTKANPDTRPEKLAELLPCPKCGASGNELCVASFGTPLPIPHDVRYALPATDTAVEEARHSAGAEQAKAVAHGHALDAEDGGYPAPTAEGLATPCNLLEGVRQEYSEAPRELFMFLISSEGDATLAALRHPTADEGDALLDGNDIWEALFGILKGDVPDEMSEAVCQQLADAIAAHLKGPDHADH